MLHDVSHADASFPPVLSCAPGLPDEKLGTLALTDWAEGSTFQSLTPHPHPSPVFLILSLHLTLTISPLSHPSPRT